MAAGRTKQLGGERVGDPWHKRLFLPREKCLTVSQSMLFTKRKNKQFRQNIQYLALYMATIAQHS